MFLKMKNSFLWEIICHLKVSFARLIMESQQIKEIFNFALDDNILIMLIDSDYD